MRSASSGTPTRPDGKVIKSAWRQNYVQDLESTRSMQPGMEVDFAGHMLATWGEHPL